MTSQRGYYPSEWEHFETPHGSPLKRPDRFTFLGKMYYVEQWVELYDRFLRDLEQRCPDLFHKLPDTPPFHSDAAYTKRFARTREHLLDGHGEPLRLPGGAQGFIYCKSTMSVKTHFWNILHLLDLFGIPERELVIYLREDRNAEDVR